MTQESLISKDAIKVLTDIIIKKVNIDRTRIEDEYKNSDELKQKVEQEYERLTIIYDDILSFIKEKEYNIEDIGIYMEDKGFSKESIECKFLYEKHVSFWDFNNSIQTEIQAKLLLQPIDSYETIIKNIYESIDVESHILQQ